MTPADHRDQPRSDPDLPLIAGAGWLEDSGGMLSWWRLRNVDRQVAPVGGGLPVVVVK